MNPDLLEEQLHRPEAETALIAALLDHRPEIQSSVPDLLPEVEPGEFYDTHNGLVWAAARNVAARGDTVTRYSLNREKVTDPMRERLNRCDGEYVTHNGMFRAAEHVKAVAFSRRMAQAVKRMLIAIAELSPSEALEVMFHEVQALKNAPQEDSTSIADAVDEYVEWTESDTQLVFTPTPWWDINGLFNGGLEAGRLYVVGARPGVGKSVWLTNVALNAAEHNHPAALFSLEMTRREVVSRIAADGAEIDLSKLLANDLEPSERRRLSMFLSRLREMPMVINDDTRTTTQSIHSACRAFKRQHGRIGVVCVDYLQLLTGDSKKPREQEVAQMSRALKLMAKDLECPVVLACQLNRQAVDREPRCSDLRESGGIEQDADAVILLHQPTDADGAPTGDIDMIVDKNRAGKKGKVTAVFHGQNATIKEYRRT